MQYEFGGGLVRFGTSIYVRRTVDLKLDSFLGDQRNLAVVTAPRQSGKTSLLHAVAANLMARGQRVAYLDFRETFGTPNEENRTADRWFPILYRALARALHLNPREVNAWITDNAMESTVHRTVLFVEEYLRNKIQGPLTLMFDEIDLVRLFWYHTDDFFDALRILATRRDALDLSIVLAGINHPTKLLKILPASTFNLSVDIAIPDFSADDTETVAEWSKGLPHSDDTRLALGRAVLEQTGGQAFLTSVLFNDVIESGVETPEAVAELAAQLVEDVRNDDRPMAHFLAPREIILEDEKDATQALLIYDQLLSNGSVEVRDIGEPTAGQLLRLAGLVVERKGVLSIKSPIYCSFFDARWVATTKRDVGRRGGERSRRGVVALKGREVKDSICVLNTGGMISAELRPDGTIDEPQDLAAFFDDFPEMHGIAHVDPVPLMGKDSSNMTPADWKTIAEAIYIRRNRGYKGFVVAHGTDTLAYTASAVAFALGSGLNFPVVFTAAQSPRHVPHGDARPNLLRACTVATMKIPEVVVVANDQIFRGVRAEKKDDYRFDSFHSPTLPPLGIIADRIEIDWNLVRKRDETRDLECQTEFSSGVFKFSFVPGLNPALLYPILDNPALKGIILETPGIGIVPTAGELSLLPFIEKATQEHRIPVLLVSQYPIQTQMSAVYALALKPAKFGAIPAANISAPAATTKLMWILPQIERRIYEGVITENEKFTEIRRWMNRNIVGELNPDQRLND